MRSEAEPKEAADPRRGQLGSRVKIYSRSYKLTINREKTKVVNAGQPGGSFDFLGYSFRYDKDLRGRNHRYWNRISSKKSMQKARSRIHDPTSARWGCLLIDEVVKRLNQFLIGRSNYFGKGYPPMAFRVRWSRFSDRKTGRNKVESERNA